MPHVAKYDYELIEQPDTQVGGWLLRLLADGQELARRDFPPVPNVDDQALASNMAYDDAVARVTEWLASIERRHPSYRPRRADDGGMYLLLPDDELLCR